jgi:hypothetical protein
MKPFEGHMQVSGTTKTETNTRVYPKGICFITTDQPLGDLALILLEPLIQKRFFLDGVLSSSSTN